MTQNIIFLQCVNLLIKAKKPNKSSLLRVNHGNKSITSVCGKQRHTHMYIHWLIWTRAGVNVGRIVNAIIAMIGNDTKV